MSAIPAGRTTALQDRIQWLLCRLTHRRQWSLYGGFVDAFVFCRYCDCPRGGDYRVWRTSGKALPHDEAGEDLQAAAECLTRAYAPLIPRTLPEPPR